MNRRMKLAAILALGTALAGATGLALAQEQTTQGGTAPEQTAPTAPQAGTPPMGPMAAFALMDADKDGKVTKDELTAHRRDRAAALDANGDGLISLDEFTAARAAMPGRGMAADPEQVKERFAERDLDGNGQLSAAELMTPGMPARMFDRFDADQDGAVSQDELVQSMWAMRGGMGGGMGEGHGKGHGRGHGHGHGDGMGGGMMGDMDGDGMGGGWGGFGRWGFDND